MRYSSVDWFETFYIFWIIFNIYLIYLRIEGEVRCFAGLVGYGKCDCTCSKLCPQSYFNPQKPIRSISDEKVLSHNDSFIYFK